MKPNLNRHRKALMDSTTDQRCTRSAGPGRWRCGETALPGKSRFQKHMLQQTNKTMKKRRDKQDRSDADSRDSGSEVRSRRYDVSRWKRRAMRTKRKKQEESEDGSDSSEDRLVLREILSRTRKGREKEREKRRVDRNVSKGMMDSGTGTYSSCEELKRSSNDAKNYGSTTGRAEKPFKKVIKFQALCLLSYFVTGPMTPNYLDFRIF